MTADQLKMDDDKFHVWLNLPKPTTSPKMAENEHRQQSPKTLHKGPAGAAKRPSREGRMKTELCRFFATNQPCPFSEQCSFAHGQADLKHCLFSDYVTDLSEAIFFRSRPCLDWVAMGSW